MNEPCVFPFVFKGKTYNACPLGKKGGQRKGHIVIRGQQGFLENIFYAIVDNSKIKTKFVYFLIVFVSIFWKDYMALDLGKENIGVLPEWIVMIKLLKVTGEFVE